MDTVGSITDAKIKIKPSQSLIDFIIEIEVCEVPENIYVIKKAIKKSTECTIIESEKDIDIKLTADDIEILKSVKQTKKDVVEEEENDIIKSSDVEKDEKSNKKSNKKSDKKIEHDFILTLSDLKWIYECIAKRNQSATNKVYLHELLADSTLILPQNEIIKRNPVLEARCKKLRAQQQARDYRDMTRNVDNQRKHEPQETIAYQINQINRQLIAILQFVFSVAAGFVFGFIGLELMFGDLDFGFRLLMGIMCSLIIAIAEIYFLAKKLNEEEVIIKVPIEVNVNEKAAETIDEKKILDDVKNPPKKKNKLDKKND